MEVTQELVDRAMTQLNITIDRYEKEHPTHKVKRFEVGKEKFRVLPKHKVDRLIGENNERVATYHLESDTCYLSPESVNSGFKYFSNNVVSTLKGLFSNTLDLPGAYLEGILMHENVHRSVGSKAVSPRRSLTHKAVMYLIAEARKEKDWLTFLSDPALGMNASGLSLNFPTGKDNKKLHLPSQLDEFMVAFTSGQILSTSPNRYSNNHLGGDSAFGAAVFLSALEFDDKHAHAMGYFLRHPKREEILSDYLANTLVDKLVAVPRTKARRNLQSEVVFSHLEGNISNLDKLLSYAYS